MKKIKNKQWLAGVRRDLDSKSEEWAKPSSSHSISKMEAIGIYLNDILTELGFPPRPHDCPLCGKTH